MDIGIDLRDLTTAALIGAGGYVAHWASKVNSVLSDTVKSAALLHEKLNGHEALDDARFEALRTRLDDVHEVVVKQH